MTTIEAAQTAIYSTLTGDATLLALLPTATSVYDSVIPQGAALPAVVFQFTPGLPDNRHGDGTLAIGQHSFVVKAVGETQNPLDVHPIADRVDTLLNGVRHNVQGSYWVDIVREQPVAYAEQNGSRHFRHSGGRYTVFVRP